MVICSWNLTDLACGFHLSLASYCVDVYTISHKEEIINSIIHTIKQYTAKLFKHYVALLVLMFVIFLQDRSLCLTTHAHTHTGKHA